MPDQSGNLPSAVQSACVHGLFIGSLGATLERLENCAGGRRHSHRNGGKQCHRALTARVSLSWIPCPGAYFATKLLAWTANCGEGQSIS